MRALILYYHKLKWMDNRQEMLDLAEAADYEVVSELTFRKFHKKNYIPELKLEELLHLISEHSVDVILVNEAVSLRYVRRLEEQIDSDDITVIDKVMLTLSIFEKKASSTEVQLQIKLAQIKYVEPRMRQVVGVSLRTEKQATDRGAGETAKQIMQSDMRHRISQMENKLEEYRAKGSEKDDGIIKIPILGFYSVGKTTLFNLLTESDRETSQEAFTTMFLKSSWSRLCGYPIELIDTIGLVDLPPTVIDSFSLMLEKIFSSQIIMICVDASAEEQHFQVQIDGLNAYYSKFAEENDLYKIIFILTKCDLIDNVQYNAKVEYIENLIDNDEQFNCECYEIIGIRYDKPKFVRQSFIKTLDLMIEEQLVSFSFEGLDPSELSLIYDNARLTDEKWDNGKANVSGIINYDLYEKKLGFLKDKLVSE